MRFMSTMSYKKTMHIHKNPYKSFITRVLRPVRNYFIIIIEDYISGGCDWSQGIPLVANDAGVSLSDGNF
jgi:hypothetical protein